MKLLPYNAQNQPFTCTDIPENTNISLESSPIENMDAIIHSKPTDTYTNETTETDFNYTLLDDGTLFSSHTVNTLIDLKDHGQIQLEIIIIIIIIIILLMKLLITQIFTKTNNTDSL